MVFKKFHACWAQATVLLVGAAGLDGSSKSGSLSPTRIRREPPTQTQTLDLQHVMAVARCSVMKGRLSNTKMPLDTKIVNSSTQHITVAPAPPAWVQPVGQTPGLGI